MIDNGEYVEYGICFVNYDVQLTVSVEEARKRIDSFWAFEYESRVIFDHPGD